MSSIGWSVPLPRPRDPATVYPRQAMEGAAMSNLIAVAHDDVEGASEVLRELQLRHALSAGEA
jgi:hypothetical protein